MNKLLPLLAFSILLLVPVGTQNALSTVSDGTVKSFQKISDTQGNFDGVLDIQGAFGLSITDLGDLDNDGVLDIAVGAGGIGVPKFFIVFLNSDGTVKDEQTISETEGGFVGPLNGAVGSPAGLSEVAKIGDLDGDGVTDLAVGSPGDIDGGTLANGAIWILFMNTDGTVKDEQKISNTAGGFGGVLDDNDRFGNSITGIDDLDGDGVEDIAVGSRADDDGGDGRGSVWIIFLNTDGTVKDEQKISDSEGNFNGVLDDGDNFGVFVESIDDLDGDGVQDLAVGAHQDDDGAVNTGAVWILFMNTDGTVKDEQKISDTQGGFDGVLEMDDIFGISIANLKDIDGDGVQDLAVGAYLDDDEDENAGAVWILFMNTDGTVKDEQKISDTQGGFDGVLEMDDIFGSSLSAIGDLDGDGVQDLAVGAFRDDDGGFNKGSVWILFLKNLEDSSLVGGKIISIGSTSLILAGAQTFSWVIPLVFSVLGIGLFVFRKSENS